MTGCLAFIFCLVAAESVAVTDEEQRRILKKEYADLPKISAMQAYILYKSGKLLIADANEAGRFKGQHCVGAFNIPSSMAEKIKLKIKKDQLIGVY
jgi:hypothetical protein